MTQYIECYTLFKNNYFSDRNFVKPRICNFIEEKIDMIGKFIKNTSWKCPSTNFRGPGKVWIKLKSHF